MWNRDNHILNIEKNRVRNNLSVKKVTEKSTFLKKILKKSPFISGIDNPFKCINKIKKSQVTNLFQLAQQLFKIPQNAFLL